MVVLGFAFLLRSLQVSQLPLDLLVLAVELLDLLLSLLWGGVVRVLQGWVLRGVVRCQGIEMDNIATTVVTGTDNGGGGAGCFYCIVLQHLSDSSGGRLWLLAWRKGSLAYLNQRGMESRIFCYGYWAWSLRLPDRFGPSFVLKCRGYFMKHNYSSFVLLEVRLRPPWGS